MAKSRGAETSSYASAQYYLHMDLISDILLRLPVKSLLRFKSVSKPWYSLIYSTNFINLHLNFSKLNPNSSYILSIPTVSPDKQVFRLHPIGSLDKPPIDIDFPLMPAHIYSVIGISNGLVCTMGNKYYSSITISNPVTGNFRKIPLLEPSSIGQVDSFYGFNSNDNGFELFRVDCETSCVKVSSFSSSANMWKDVKVKMGEDEIYTKGTEFMQPLIRVPVFKDGVFYWEAYDEGDGYVLTFDVNNKVFDAILALEDDYMADIGLINFKEQLVLVILANKKIDLRTLNENNKTWQMFKSIDIGDSIPAYDEATIFGCIRNDKLALACYSYSSTRLYLYNLDADDTNNLPYVDVKGGDVMFLFVESLAAVGIGDFGDEV